MDVVANRSGPWGKAISEIILDGLPHLLGGQACHVGRGGNRHLELGGQAQWPAGRDLILLKVQE